MGARGRDAGPLFVSLDPGAGRAGRRGRPRAAAERLTGEGVAHILAVLGERAKIGGRVRPHGLRHTAITALLDAGAGLREAQRFSRHADPRTLMRYDDNRSDIGGAMARVVSDLM
jgi:integrase/recombinase XerC